mgnify:CR=1 FL=1
MKIRVQARSYRRLRLDVVTTVLQCYNEIPRLAALARDDRLIFFSSLSWLVMTVSSFGCLPAALRSQLKAMWDDSLGLAVLVRSVCR